MEINTMPIGLKLVKTEFFFVIHQILEMMEWHCKIQSKRLHNALEDHSTAHFERWIHVHLPSDDEHAVNPIDDVTLDLLLVLINQPILTHFLLVS